jgi:hypothetical protein
MIRAAVRSPGAVEGLEAAQGSAAAAEALAWQGLVQSGAAQSLAKREARAPHFKR